MSDMYIYLLVLSQIIVQGESSKTTRNLDIVSSESDEIEQPKGFNNSELSFSDFLKRAIVIFKSFDDDDLEHVFINMEDELNKYNNHELIKNTKANKLYKDILNTLNKSSVKQLREHLDTILERLRYKRANPKLTNLIKFANEFYKNDSTQFLIILKDLYQFRHKTQRSGVDLSSLISNGVKYLFFDRYNNLDTKNKLDVEVEFDYFFENSREESEPPMTTTHKPPRSKHGRQGRNKKHPPPVFWLLQQIAAHLTEKPLTLWRAQPSKHDLDVPDYDEFMTWAWPKMKKEQLNNALKSLKAEGVDINPYDELPVSVELPWSKIKPHGNRLVDLFPPDGWWRNQKLKEMVVQMLENGQFDTKKYLHTLQKTHNKHSGYKKKDLFISLLEN